MDVSIITSLFKSERFLGRYLRRIEIFNKKLSLQNIDIEFLIIANDISSDEEALLSRCSLNNIRVIKVPRETLYASWNRGIIESSADIIAFWNVDDMRLSRGFLNGVNEIRDGAQLVYFSFIMTGLTTITLFKKKVTIPFYNLKRTKAKAYNRDLFMNGCMCGPFFMFQRYVFDTIGPFDEKFIVAGDFDWFARAAYMNIKFKKVDSLGGIFFTHSGNLTVKYSKIQAEENNTILSRYRFSE